MDRVQAGRLERLETLIRWLPEAIDGGGGINGWISGGRESKCLLFGPLYYDQHGYPLQVWLELRRTMTLLDVRARKHLLGRYLEGVTRRAPVRFTSKGIPLTPLRTEVLVKGGANGPSKHVLDCVVHTWPAWVNETVSDQALLALEATFRGSIDLPTDLIAA